MSSSRMNHTGAWPCQTDALECFEHLRTENSVSIAMNRNEQDPKKSARAKRLRGQLKSTHGHSSWTLEIQAKDDPNQVFDRCSIPNWLVTVSESRGRSWEDAPKKSKSMVRKKWFGYFVAPCFSCPCFHPIILASDTAQKSCRAILDSQSHQVFPPINF